MASENVQNKGASLFKTPNPSELKADAAKVPAKDRHDGNDEGKVSDDLNDAVHHDENVDTPEVELDRAKTNNLSDSQIINANISGH
jgi:hypothetical protein